MILIYHVLYLAMQLIYICLISTVFAFQLINDIKYDNIRCHKMCYSTTTYSLHDTEHNILINFENLNFQKTRVKGGRRVTNS
jgi:hypothetical protein